jgi:hypothetical protein
MIEIPVECINKHSQKILSGVLSCDDNNNWKLKLCDKTEIPARFLETVIQTAEEKGIINIKGRASYLKRNRIELKKINNKFVINLFIGNTKSDQERCFDTSEEMMDEVKRLVKGLRLPPDSVVLDKESEDDRS